MSAYATADELARVLEIRAPTAEQTTALERVLVAAALEIDREIDIDPDADPPDTLSADELALVEQVNLQRGAELWGLQEVPLGVSGLGGDLGTSNLARNSWAKYQFTLAPLKRRWGVG